MPPGVYDLTFELSGFQTTKREGIRVVINTTLTVDQQLQVATPAGNGHRDGRVAGRRHVDDARRHQLHQGTAHRDSQRARHLGGDGAGARLPDDRLRRRRLAHRARRPGFIAYGVSQQRTTRIEGVNTTEGTDANAGYFDFGSFEEFQLGGAGNMADHDSGGGSMNIIVKSGGDRFTGNWYSDWEGDATITDNVPDDVQRRRTSVTTTASSSARRSRAATPSIGSTTSTPTSAARSGRARRGSSTRTVSTTSTSTCSTSTSWRARS